MHKDDNSNIFGENNKNDYTYGCIRMSNDDVLELANYVESQLRDDVPAYLQVTS